MGSFLPDSSSLHQSAFCGTLPRDNHVGLSLCATRVGCGDGNNGGGCDFAHHRRVMFVCRVNLSGGIISKKTMKPYLDAWIKASE